MIIAKDRLIEIFKKEHNPHIWGFNNAPSADELIETLSQFSIINLDIVAGAIFLEFSHRLFTLEETVRFATKLRADEIDIIERNKIRLWWD